MSPELRIEMLGGLRVTQGETVISRFRTRRVGLLLAYLAFFPNRSHRRAELGEMIWPEQEAKSSAHNLRQALLSLKRQIEPPPIVPGSVLVTTHTDLQLSPAALWTDTSEFEELVRLAASTKLVPDRIVLLKSAVDLYKGDLLPGYDEDWVVRERHRLEDLFVESIRELIAGGVSDGRTAERAHYLRVAIAKEPYDESLHVELMRHYLDSGRPSDVIRHHRDLARQLADHLRAEPCEQANSLAAMARRVLRSNAPQAFVADRASVGVHHAQGAGNASEPTETGDTGDTFAPRTKLPTRLTRFFGRSLELSMIEDALLDRSARLVTIVGPPGAGKTTLGLEAARRISKTHNWSVWFVPLADLTEGMILEAVANALGIRQSDRGDVIELIRAELAPSDNLLVLDNVEHILEAAIPVIESLIDRLPEICILVTSRQILRMSGEHEIQLDPFPVPGEQEDETAEGSFDLSVDPLSVSKIGSSNGHVNGPEVGLESLSSYACVQLFVNRCQLVRPDFQLTRSNAKHIVAICQKMEGLPLALDIAAGLTNVFTLTQMVQQIDERLTVLSSRRRDVPPRHRSLRAAMDYSFETLPKRMQDFFCALSVFRGGFDLDGVIGIVEPWVRESASPEATFSRLPDEEALEMILGLQERSLVRSVMEVDDGPARFQLLDSFREYAETRLSTADRADLCRRHASHFLQATSRAAPNVLHSIGGNPQPQDLANLRAATQYFFDQGEFESCVHLLYLRRQFIVDSRWSTERDLIARLNSQPEISGIDPSARIEFLHLVGRTHVFATEYEQAYACFEEALKIAESLKDEVQIVRCCNALGNCVGYFRPTEESLVWWRRMLADARRAGLMPELEAAYIGVGTCMWQLGELGEAEDAFLNALRISSEFRQGEALWLVNYNLARIYLDLGRLDDAMVRTGDAMRQAKRVGDVFGIGMSYHLISRYHWCIGDLQRALSNSLQSLTYKHRTQFIHWIANGIAFHALLLAEGGVPEPAVKLFAAVARHGQFEPGYHQEHIKALADLRQQLPSLTFDRLWALGLAMDVHEAFELAMQNRELG